MPAGWLPPITPGMHVTPILFICIVLYSSIVMNYSTIDFERAMMTFYEAVNRANHNNAIGMMYVFIPLRVQCVWKWLLFTIWSCTVYNSCYAILVYYNG